MFRPFSSPRILLTGLALGLLGSAALPAPAGAVLDIEDRGPSLFSEWFQLRVTNCGIVGNAFFDVGRSTDPSFETPPGSGREALHYATLWVGGRLSDGTVHVSGGSLLEFRPTPDPEDRVRIRASDRPGAVRFYDDDNDGAEDEERLNGVDDDGDGEVDEDLGMFSTDVAVARFVDDRPEAVEFAYPGGESHRPLGITVDQEVYSWAVPGYDRAAGIRWVITNHSPNTVEDVYLGIFADLDSRDRSDATGHINDRVVRLGYDRAIRRGGSLPTEGGCAARASQTLYGIADRDTIRSGLPFVTVLPLSHTVDPLANYDSLLTRSAARAPRTVGFRSQVLEVNGIPGQGGIPVTDLERYAAMRGETAPPVTDRPGDWAVLVSCGPFPRLDPGQSIELNAAIVAATTRDTIQAQMGNLAVLEQGIRFNRQPDFPSAPPGPGPWNGATGINGHEGCLRVPVGVTLWAEPHCLKKFEEPALDGPLVLFPSDTCVWSDADCDPCTGSGGLDTEFRWLDPGLLPPPPAFRVIPRDGRVRIEWDNYPELLPAAGLLGWSETRFVGYRVWKVSDWTTRESLMPDLDRWSLALNAGDDPQSGAIPYATLRDTTLDYERILYEQRLYPVGRYAWEDTEVTNGFDLLYFVGAMYELRLREPDGYLRIRRVESPIQATFDARVTPRSEAATLAGRVHVVPNPYRGSAPWERRPVLGDAPTNHVDFVDMPRAAATIRIWTLAGDLVDQIDHDGRDGNGRVSWDLISRNGQDVASGVYLFTVRSGFGEQTGRFVVIR